MITVTIKGPQGCGKTNLAKLIQVAIEREASSSGSRRRVDVLDVGNQPKAVRRKAIAEFTKRAPFETTTKDVVIVVRQTC